MKRSLIALVAITVIAAAAAAQTTKDVTLIAGRQRSIAHSGLKVKFIAVTEDSRCPAGAACVWAGNARVRIEVSKAGKASKTLELNTGIEPRNVEYEGYKISLLSVTPKPGEYPAGKAPPASITLSFSRQ